MDGDPGQAFRNVLQAVGEVRKFELGDVIILCHATEDVNVKEEIVILLTAMQFLVKVCQQFLCDLLIFKLIRIIILLDDTDMVFFHLQMPCQDSHFIRKKRLVATVPMTRTFGLVIEVLRKNALRCVAIVWSVQHSFTRKMGGAVFPTSVH